MTVLRLRAVRRLYYAYLQGGGAKPCADSSPAPRRSVRIIDRLQPRIVEIARQRGLNWAGLSDKERERLVDDILHE